MTNEREIIFEALASEELGDALEEASPERMREQGDFGLAFLVELYHDTVERIIAELEQEDGTQ